MYSHQDWTPVILKKREKSYNTSEKDVNEARRNNKAIETHNKLYNNKPNNVSNPSINARKLEQETEDFHLKKVPTDIGKAIERGRIAKKLTRSQLAQSFNFKEKYIEEIEKGSALYNGSDLARIKRFLEIK
jgi:ribosome-binding protein aMBF1 (putative translation factor)